MDNQVSCFPLSPLSSIFLSLRFAHGLQFLVSSPELITPDEASYQMRQNVSEHLAIRKRLTKEKSSTSSFFAEYNN